MTLWEVSKGIIKGKSRNIGVDRGGPTILPFSQKKKGEKPIGPSKRRQPCTLEIIGEEKKTPKGMHFGRLVNPIGTEGAEKV